MPDDPLQIVTPLNVADQGQLVAWDRGTAIAQTPIIGGTALIVKQGGTYYAYGDHGAVLRDRKQDIFRSRPTIDDEVVLVSTLSGAILYERLTNYEDTATGTYEIWLQVGSNDAIRLLLRDLYITDDDTTDGGGGGGADFTYPPGGMDLPPGAAELYYPPGEEPVNPLPNGPVEFNFNGPFKVLYKWTRSQNVGNPSESDITIETFQDQGSVYDDDFNDTGIDDSFIGPFGGIHIDYGGYDGEEFSSQYIRFVWVRGTRNGENVWFQLSLGSTLTAKRRDFQLLGIEAINPGNPGVPTNPTDPAPGFPTEFDDPGNPDPPQPIGYVPTPPTFAPSGPPDPPNDKHTIEWHVPMLSILNGTTYLVQAIVKDEDFYNDSTSQIDLYSWVVDGDSVIQSSEELTVDIDSAVTYSTHAAYANWLVSESTQTAAPPNYATAWENSLDDAGNIATLNIDEDLTEKSVKAIDGDIYKQYFPLADALSSKNKDVVPSKQVSLTGDLADFGYGGSVPSIDSVTVYGFKAV